jgi:seryl-tRNA synthetase
MSKNQGSKDRYLEALDVVINVLKEHGQILDKSIHELGTVTEQIGDITVLNSKVEMVEEKLNNLQTEVTDLIGGLSNVPKEAIQAAVDEQEPQVLETPAVSVAVVQTGRTLILHCKQWGDFEVLASHAQALSFSYEENETAFGANAIKGNQIIKYTGVFPNFSTILKTWLSRRLEIVETNIFEGFLDKPNNKTANPQFG